MADILNQWDDGTLTGIDGTAVEALECEVQFLNGDMNFEGFRAGGTGRAAQVYQTRGKVHSIRKGEREFPVISFSAMAGSLSKANGSTFLDFLHGKEEYAGRVSTMANSDFFHCDLKWVNANGDEQLWEDCLVEWTGSEGDPNNISFTATVYGAHPFDEEA